MKQSNQRSSGGSKQYEIQQTVPTKRYNTFQIPSRLKYNQLSTMNTSRSSDVIACAFHIDQKITNFCKNKECLLPLCPKCVGIHCQEHAKMGIFGNFITLDDSIIEVHQNLKQIFSKIESFDKFVQIGKQSIETKNKKLIEKLHQAKDKFIQKMLSMFQSLEQAITNIWLIEQNIQSQQLKKNQQHSNMLYQNYNSCLKKMMNPSQRLQGIISYFYHEQTFKTINQAQQSIHNLINRPQISLQFNQTKAKAIQSLLKACFTISNQEEVWSEFKVLNIRNPNIKYTFNQNGNFSEYQINRKDNYGQKSFLNLDNFISPLEKFSLEILRAQRCTNDCLSSY